MLYADRYSDFSENWYSVRKKQFVVKFVMSIKNYKFVCTFPTIVLITIVFFNL